MICVTALFLDGKLRHIIWYMYPNFFTIRRICFMINTCILVILFFCIIVWYILNIKLICIMCIHIVSLMLEMKYIFHYERLIQTCLTRFNNVILNKRELFGGVFCNFDICYEEYNVSVHYNFKIYCGYNVAKVTYIWWNNFY